MTVHALRMSPPGQPTLLCFSHLRWDFVYQRPQHLMSRLARSYRVLFVEEPLPAQDGVRRMVEREGAPGVRVFVPHLPGDDLADPHRAIQAQRRLLDELVARERAQDAVLWFYTPVALSFAGHLLPRATIYDCMDELSAFAGAPTDMSAREARLLARADLVLTGGRSLFQAKRHLHPNVHCIPSSVDVAHFGQARRPLAEPQDQASIPWPRIGFAGVIDERMDLELLEGASRLRPDWHFVMLGPVVKIDPGSLPLGANIHYLGMKPYQQLPAYISGWNAAMMPFARNAATRFISPTKTPEYLAAGRPVVSTAIPDVVATYGAKRLAFIADTPADFVAALATALRTPLIPFRRRVDRFLDTQSWDRSIATIQRLMAQLDGRRADLEHGHQPAVAAR